MDMMELLRGSPQDESADVERMREHLSTQIESRIEAFVSCWNESFDHADRLRWWTAYLAGHQQE